MSSITVCRNKSRWQDRARDYHVLVDGEMRASVANGESCTLPVTPGNHTVQMKIDWCYSPLETVAVDNSGAVVLECGANAHPLLALLYVSVWRNNYIWLRRSVG